MQALVPYGQTSLRLKENDQLPPHITRRDYQDFLDAVDRRYAHPSKRAEKAQWFHDRDRLLLRLMWETGGRVGDILSAKPGSFDFKAKVLNLLVKRRKNVNTPPLDDGLLVEVSNFLRNYPPADYDGELLQLSATVLEVDREPDRGPQSCLVSTYGKALAPTLVDGGTTGSSLSRGAEADL